MAVLGLSLVVGAIPAGASTRASRDSNTEASRGKKPTSTTDSTTPPSTVTVEPSSTTATTAKPTPARSRTPQVELPTTTSTLHSPVSGAPSPSVGSGAPTSPTTGAENPHFVEREENSVPLPAFGEAAPTTTSTEVSEPVVGNIGEDSGAKPGAARQPTSDQPAKALGATGAPTRPLLILAGGSLMLGALAVALGEPSPMRAAGAPTAGTVPVPRRRRPPVRRTLPGWESGVPLAPERRERARQRMQRRQTGPRVSRPGGARGA